MKSNQPFVTVIPSSGSTFSQREESCKNTTNTSEVDAFEGNLLLPTFTTASKIRVAVTFILFAISAFLNLAVLFSTLRNHRGKKSHIRTLILNLCCADLLVTGIVMPLDAAWNTTVQWNGGNIACKFLMFMKLVAMYSCAFVTVVISIDRYCVILHPLGIGSANQRNTIILTVAWVLSTVFAVPQLFLFHTVSISQPAPFTQCVTHGSFSEPWQEKAYFLFTFTGLFLVPLVVMVFCYTRIFVTVSRKLNTGDMHCKHAALRCTRDNTPKVRMKTLRMTIVLMGTFILCWTPYYVLGFWYCFFPEMINTQAVPEAINHVLFIFGLLNSFLDPIISQLGYLKIKKGQTPFCQDLIGLHV
ncbi:GNRR2 protein, partial [Polyodon spathula]|nr:gonadotropin-releasing hormone II receptor-like [Polyodon spathula]MBN3280067.1 GNRR2 protein [Polyodon spathula]